MEESFYVSEAKEHLSEINISIRETRNKCWQLLGGILVIEAFFVNSFLDNVLSPTTKLLLYLTTAYLVVVLIALAGSILPVAFHMNGDEPKYYSTIKEDEILGVYQFKIEENASILDTLSNRFSFAIALTVFWAIACALCVMFTKS